MNVAVACIVFFLAVTQALPEEMEFNEDRYWPETYQNQADLQPDIEDPILERYLVRIARKARPAHIYELFTKRSKEFKRMSPNLQRNSFVGLMGKRSLSSDKIKAGENKTPRTELNVKRRKHWLESEESDVDLDFNRRRK